MIGEPPSLDGAFQVMVLLLASPDTDTLVGAPGAARGLWLAEAFDGPVGGDGGGVGSCSLMLNRLT